MKEKERNFEKVRYSCMAAALIICVCAGFGYAWSVLQSPIIAKYNWPDSEVSLNYTITVVCSTMAPLLFGGLIKKLPPRISVVIGAVLIGGGLTLTGFMSLGVWQLYLFYGVIAGLGCGFIYPTMMAYVVKLFPDRPGMASGLGTAAYGSGAIIWAPVAVSITNNLDISATFKILGAIFFIVICSCSTLVKTPPEGFSPNIVGKIKKSKSEVTEKYNLRRSEMVKTVEFYMMVAVFTCGLVAGVIIISQASPILQQTLKYTAAKASIFVSIFAACNMAGRFIWGSVSDKIGFNKSILFIFSLCVISMLTLAIVKAEVIIILAMGLAASCYGGFASLLTPMTAKVFGRKYVTENYGVMYVVFGIASFIGPILAVQFKIASKGSYTGAFLTAAAISIIGSILSISLNKLINKPKSVQNKAVI